MAKLVLREYTVKSERVRSSVDIALVSDLHRLIDAAIAFILEIWHFQDMRKRCPTAN